MSLAAGTGPPATPRLLVYIAGVASAALVLAVVAWQVAPLTALMLPRLLILCALGVLSWNLREPDVGSRISFSFLSVILVAAAAIVGPFGAAVLGFVAVTVDTAPQGWYQRAFNMAMCSAIGSAGGLAYIAMGGSADPALLDGVVPLAVEIGLPLLAVDLVQCLVNGLLLAGVIHLHRDRPFWGMLRGILSTTGIAYVGYGVIGFLFVILWFPAGLGWFSAVLILAPLLSARWAFIQYGDERRAHERTLDGLVTALGAKEPAAVPRSRRMSILARWLGEALNLSPAQSRAATQAATLHEIGHLGVPPQVLRTPPEALEPSARRLVEDHGVIGARMIEGIDFLESARPGIRHQHERFDGGGGPDGLAGGEIPLTGRIVALAAAFDALTEGSLSPAATPAEALEVLRAERGRFDPALLTELERVLERHAWPPSGEGGR